MVLSNACKCLLLTGFCVILAWGCGNRPVTGNLPTLSVPEPSTDFPFLTKEPEVYQAEIVATGGGLEKKWFVARNRDRWRMDFFSGSKLVRTRIQNEGAYSIDHADKIFSVIEGSGETVSDLTSRLFKGKEYRKFEKIDSVNGITRFRSQLIEGKDAVIVTVDDTTGMTIRLEFTSNQTSSWNFGYEIRDLKYEVDNSIFDVPTGYRRVSIDQFLNAAKPNE